ncbi:related to transcriptional activator Mut3p [Phialocephala subalpina]|uniref:Related to transcriptional activator Mut3p n=1 Tax=Phialocephala subalpina TaxID=576137 RepID=A0A1L7XS83_9HELO|nr:related to transcriptional activator Mut3p [Phialocephala subalpina]
MNHQNHFHVPASQPTMNQLPQIFNTCTPDGPQLVPASLPHATDQPFGDNSTWLDENNEANRSRILRACEACRTKKIKCDAKMPACTHCIKYSRECIFRSVERKGKRRKGAKYIEGLEKRLGRMESLLRSSGLLEEVKDIHTRGSRLDRQTGTNGMKQRSETAVPGSQTNPHPVSAIQNIMGDSSMSNPTSIVTSPELPKAVEPGRGEGPTKEEIELLSDRMCSLMTNNWGEAKYIGSSSGFSIFSPKGIEWVDEKMGDTSFQGIMASVVDDNRFHHLELQVFSELFQRRIYEQLPSKKECLGLLEDFFGNFNRVLPLFHQPTFMHLVERQYSSDPYGGSGWWACLNIALAIAHRLRVRNSLIPVEEERKSWGYLKNSMGVLAELIVQNTDLFSVQALLGMALFMSCTSNPQPSFCLVAASIRLSHSIGLHKRGSGFNFSPIEIEQRNRVFWIAYTLDKEICLRSGRPPAQNDDDMNVELPSPEPEDNVGIILLADNKVNLFRLMSQFATIQSKVYKQLYSTDAAKQSAAQLLNNIGELDNQLEEWKAGIPRGFRPDHGDSVSHTPFILQVVVLHLAYYNCLATIHRISGFWSSRLSTHTIQDIKSRLLNHRVFQSSALCVAAARASIHLLKYIPQEDSAYVWLILYYPISSLISLFSNILRNPQDCKARADLHLMDSVVKFLCALSTKEGDRSIKQMLNVCSEFERIANAILERSDKQTSLRKKPKNHGDPTVTPLPLTRPVVNMIPSSVNRQSPVVFSPGMPNQMNGRLDHTGPDPLNGSFTGRDWIPDLATGEMFQDYTMPPENGMSLFADIQQMNNGISIGDLQPSVNFNTLQRSLLPQNLWLMPMTLEWDWAEVIDRGYPSIGTGQSGDTAINGRTEPLAD